MKWSTLLYSQGNQSSRWLHKLSVVIQFRMIEALEDLFNRQLRATLPLCVTWSPGRGLSHMIRLCGKLDCYQLTNSEAGGEVWERCYFEDGNSVFHFPSSLPPSLPFLLFFFWKKKTVCMQRSCQFSPYWCVHPQSPSVVACSSSVRGRLPWATPCPIRNECILVRGRDLTINRRAKEGERQKGGGGGGGGHWFLWAEGQGSWAAAGGVTVSLNVSLCKPDMKYS